MSALVIRNTEGFGDVRIEHGRIAAIGDAVTAGAEILDANGGALIPGLIDHHIHLFASAARFASIDVSSARGKDGLLAILRAACARRTEGAWVRAIGYDDSVMGLLSRDDLDLVQHANPIRLQDRTGALWVLNTLALERVLGDGADAPFVERDSSGRASGRIWRGDAWLRTRVDTTPPSLATLSNTLAAYGITGVTDTGASNGPIEAEMLARAQARGELVQSLYLMSSSAIDASPHYGIGPIKILPDERDLPALEDVVARIGAARALSRAVAVHCISAGELALTLAAFESAGARHGDRIEHGGMIPAPFIETIKRLGLTVVTQPNFIHDRGDRYARSIPPHELPDLYRLRSLIDAGVRIAAGSDGPYGGLDPWQSIQAATDRATRAGLVLGADERIGARRALGLFLGPFGDPAGGERRIDVDEPADLCLLRTPLSQALAEPSSANVAATIARGEMIYRAD
jgi:predicted amidohydrolase YtcJ